VKYATYEDGCILVWGVDRKSRVGPDENFLKCDVYLFFFYKSSLLATQQAHPYILFLNLLHWSWLFSEAGVGTYQTKLDLQALQKGSGGVCNKLTQTKASLGVQMLSEQREGPSARLLRCREPRWPPQ